MTFFVYFYQAIIKPQYVDQIPKAVKVSYYFSSS